MLEDTEGFTALAMENTVSQPLNQGLYARFHTKAIQDPVATLKEGRPIFTEAEYVEIRVAGDKSSVINRPVRLGAHLDHDNNRFSREYNLFKQGLAQVIEGTPLSEWPMISQSQVKELEFFDVKTVELLAGMPDTAVQNFVGVAALREKARDYIATAKKGASSAQLAAELGARDATIDAQQAQIDEMQAQMAKLMDNAPELASDLDGIEDDTKEKAVAAEETQKTKRRRTRR